ncbi:hypothetical protein OAU18_00940 [Schleiferiaceae bacterium]|nr:hypothetical protein [Schleiferiaceae bacterium]
MKVKGVLPTKTEDGYEVVYSKFRVQKGIVAKFAIFYEQYKIFKELKNCDSLWLYNLNIMNALLFLLVTLFRRKVKVNVIILDFTPADSWKNQNFWYLRLINRAHGAICLSDSSLFTIQNRVVLPGVVPIGKKNFPRIECPNNEFLLSGVISPAISSTNIVLEAFALMPELSLHITGNVLEGEDVIIHYASNYHNIHYYGAVSYDDYLDIMHRVTFQLSTRDKDYPENQCNFPSKIIEALLHNRIVISTMSYQQLDGIKYFSIDSSLESLKHQILKISQMPSEDLLWYANQSRSVREMFSPDVWNKAMTDIENYSK